MTTYTINQTNIFSDWLTSLKDPIGKAGIAVRIKRAENGNFGDSKLLPNTGGIYEMRVFKGNGYRVYYAQQGETVYLLLMGGAKDSQQPDINRAVKLWRTIQAQDTPKHDNR